MPSARLAHRGPDACGTVQRPGLALVHRRLSVIDLSDRASQPLTRDDLGLVIVYNGEIYNYRELRQELVDAGATFTSDSDTEVLLMLFRREGPAAFRRVRGMFAAAIFDVRSNRLTLARDPLGKKPLVYAWDDGTLIFGSSVAAVSAALSRQPPIDDASVAHFFAHLAVPQSRTIFRGVERVPPGCCLQFESTGLVREHRYWTAESGRAWTGSEAELSALVEEGLRTAVRRRLVADVPVGAFLSAGRDSGLIVALAAEESHGTLRTFTAGTAGYDLDERSAARLVAERYSTDHTEIEVPPLSAALLPELLQQLGEPFGDASILPTAAIARAARAYLKVVLTGDGGDELFYGYSIFNGVRLAERLRRVAPAALLELAREATRGNDGRGWRNKADALLQYATHGVSNRMGFDSHDRMRLLRRGAATDTDAIYRHGHRPGASAVDELRRVLLTTWLPNDYLVKVDTATMAAGLEARSPFLDLDLAELMLSVPAEIGFRHGRNKRLLEPLVARYLPEELQHRRKTGFGIPIREWLLGPLAPAFDSLVLAAGLPIHEWINPEAAREAYGALQRGGTRADRVWCLLVFGLWHALVVEGRPEAQRWFGDA